ncbi:hypothetical protein BT69DRAFT_1285159 [Atractiella rhizophila]|nr:hypothetical protein BT69DRAFT_1285159 [Atractiella rhizophila]
MGAVFCSDACRETWIKDMGEEGQEARKEVQKFLNRRPKNEEKDNDEDEDDPPTRSDIENTWNGIESQAVSIRRARSSTLSPTPTKVDRLALQGTLTALPPDTSTTFYLFSFLHYTSSSSRDILEDLCISTRPYHTSQELVNTNRAYLALLALLPSQRAERLTRDMVEDLMGRSACNVFGIWSPEEAGSTSGSEMLGYGLWPDAAYFNHSCSPNVRKERKGRNWTFWVSRDVEKDEELCISYLGGDEETAGVKERAVRLQEWGFECRCEKCVLERGIFELQMSGT